MNELVTVVSTKRDLLDFGYNVDNKHKEVIYNNQSFTLKKHGIRHIIYPFPSNVNPRQPIWNIKLGELFITITDIQ